MILFNCSIYFFSATVKHWVQGLNYSNPKLALNNGNGRRIREGKEKGINNAGKKNQPVFSTAKKSGVKFHNTGF